MTARGDSSRARHALRGLLGQMESDVREAVETGARVAELAARGTDQWKDRSGKTRKSIRAKVTKRGFGFQIRGAGASLYLEHGTAPHVISAKGPPGPRMLRFVIGGSVIYRRSVYHPGTKATFYLEHSVVEGAQTVSRNLPALFRRAAEQRGLGGR